jgi:acetyl esterase/lipase
MGWLIVGIVVLAWPDLTVRGVALVVGIGMVANGASELLGVTRGSPDMRLASLLRGVAHVAFGLLALAWPDVTLLVVAVVFGARTVLFGIALTVVALRRGDETAPTTSAVEDHTRHRPPALARTKNVVTSAVALLVAVTLGGISAQLNEGEPAVDDFYDAPNDIPTAPGVLLRSERFTRTIPDDADAWRILYTTTDDDGDAALASAIVVAPAVRSGALPVIAWSHGTTGVDRTCAPSVLAEPLGSGAFFVLDEVMTEGWALVATDYAGLGTAGPHPYLIGEGEGHSVLDAVRAARSLRDVSLADETVVWGHSQGGHAALWTGQVASSYAPDVPLAGVAALAPASDPPGLVGNLYDTPGGSIFASYVLTAYAATYADVDLNDYVAPTARVTVRELAQRCLGEPAVLASVLTSLATDMSVFDADLRKGPLAERLKQNRPVGPVDAPLLIAQGESDVLVVPDVQAEYAGARCDSGQPLEYRTYRGRDHVGLVAADSQLIPELVAWTRDRLSSTNPQDDCGKL